MPSLLEISDAMSNELRLLTFAPPITHVYNPLDYARDVHAEYLARYGGGPKEIVLVGMNPGPFGMRLWGWARDSFGTPQKFFSRFFVHNYCPLCFMEASGRNFTPNKLPASERAQVNEACDHALRGVVETLSPRYVLGVGHFAESRAREALKGLDVTVGRIPHPSPASPAANRGWAKEASKAFTELGISL